MMAIQEKTTKESHKNQNVMKINLNSVLNGRMKKKQGTQKSRLLC